MAFSNISNLTLGQILQIAFSNGIRVQISQDFRDFEYIKRQKVSQSSPRELRFMLQSSLNPASVQYRNPGTANRAYPRGFQPQINEYTARFKEVQATLELEQNLWERAQISPEKYAQPLETVINSTMVSSKRRLAADLYGDGTGVVGQIGASAAAVTSPASNQLTFQLSSATSDSARGHAGFFEYGDILVLKTLAGATTALDTNLATEPAYWKVVNRNYRTQVVTLQGLDSNFDPVATITTVTTPAEANSVFYRFDQPTIPNLSGAISDYGTVTEVIPGLESLAAADGRSIYGMTMSGATGGTQVDAAGAPFDVKHIQQALDDVKRQVGQGLYKWKQMNMQSETQAALIESRETDRRFQSIEDNKRGVRMFAYVHGNDTVEMNASEYVPPKRAWLIPEGSGGEKVIEYHGTDYKTVKASSGADDWRLKVSGGQYVNVMQSFLQAVGIMICKHPAAIVSVRNFVNS